VTRHAAHEEGRHARPSFFSVGPSAWFHRARTEARLAPAAAFALTLFPVIFVPTFGWFLALRETHAATYVLLMENGVVELSTFAFFIAAAVAALVRGVQLARRSVAPFVSRFYFLWGVIAFLGGMEEIAWGQSFLHFKTPWGLQNVNEQGELTIHNLPGLQDLNTFLLLAFGLVACGFWWARRSRRWRDVSAPPLLAPYALTITLAGGMCFLVDVFYFSKAFDLVIGMLSEVVEMLMGLYMLLFVILNTRAERPPSPPS